MGRGPLDEIHTAARKANIRWVGNPRGSHRNNPPDPPNDPVFTSLPRTASLNATSTMAGIMGRSDAGGHLGLCSNCTNEQLIQQRLAEDQHECTNTYARVQYLCNLLTYAKTFQSCSAICP